jgi:hypothetical protein
MSNWAVAAWFVEPNALLEARRPVELIDADLGAVLAAARGHATARTPQRAVLAHC